MSEKKGLYDLNPNSNWAKLFEWIWGVNPSEKYKTMCPYFWQYVLTILILPIALAGRLVIMLVEPWISSAKDNNRLSNERTFNKLVDSLEDATTDKELHKIRFSKCFIKNSSRLRYDYFDLWDKTHIAAERYYNKVVCPKKELKQEKIDKIKYGKVGTIIAYVVGALTLYCVYEFLSWVAHLITFTEFTGAIGIVSLVALAVLSFYGFFWLIGLTIKAIANNSACNEKLQSFGTGVGNVFAFIGRGIQLVFDMVINVYKKSCPTIHWDKD